MPTLFFRHALFATLCITGLALPVHSAAAQNSAANDTPKHTFNSIDTDKDGRISRNEFAAAHSGKSEKFSSIDRNGDGFISKDEFDAHHAAMQGQHSSH